MASRSPMAGDATKLDEAWRKGLASATLKVTKCKKHLKTFLSRTDIQRLDITGALKRHKTVADTVSALLADLPAKLKEDGTPKLELITFEMLEIDDWQPLADFIRTESPSQRIGLYFQCCDFTELGSIILSDLLQSNIHRFVYLGFRFSTRGTRFGGLTRNTCLHSLEITEAKGDLCFDILRHVEHNSSLKHVYLRLFDITEANTSTDSKSPPLDEGPRLSLEHFNLWNDALLVRRAISEKVTARLNEVLRRSQGLKNVEFHEVNLSNSIELLDGVKSKKLDLFKCYGLLPSSISRMIVEGRVKELHLCVDDFESEECIQEALHAGVSNLDHLRLHYWNQKVKFVSVLTEVLERRDAPKSLMFSGDFDREEYSNLANALPDNHNLERLQTGFFAREESKLLLEKAGALPNLKYLGLYLGGGVVLDDEYMGLLSQCLGLTEFPAYPNDTKVLRILDRNRSWKDLVTRRDDYSEGIIANMLASSKASNLYFIYAVLKLKPDIICVSRKRKRDELQ